MQNGQIKVKKAQNISSVLEKVNISKNTIKKLKRDDGMRTKTDADITEEGFGFYKDLNNKENIDENDIKLYLEDSGNLNV